MARWRLALALLTLLAALAAPTLAHASFGMVTKWGQFGIPPSSYLPATLAADSSGNVYVVDMRLNEIVKFDASGNAVSAFGRGLLGFNLGGIAVNSTMGLVYVADKGANKVYRFTTAGALLGSWTASAPTDVEVDSSGSVYTVDSTNGRVVKSAADGTSPSFIGTLGTGDGQLSTPSGVALDPSGNIYVADAGNNRVQEFNAAGAFLTKWTVTGANLIAVSGSYVFVSHGATIERYTLAGAPSATWTSTSGGAFSTLEGLAVSGSNLLMTESLKPKVTSLLAVDGTVAATWTFDGLGDGAGSFQGINGVAQAANGDIYVTDVQNYRVQRFSETGTYLGAFGSRGNTNGLFMTPDGIAVSPTTGDVYVSDVDNLAYRVQRFSSSGAFISVIATGGSGAGQVSLPADLATASDGSVYIAEYNNKRIQHLSGTGAFMDSFPLVNGPTGVAVAANGDIYVAYQSSKVERYSSGGTLLGTLGSTSSPFNFGSVVDVAVGSDGDVYTADYSADKVVRMSATGTFKESFGSHGNGDGQFDLPDSLIGGSNGYVYVADTNQNRIQRFGQSPATPAAPTPSASVTQGALDVSWSAVTDPNGDSVTYSLERQRGGIVTGIISGVTDLAHSWTNGAPEVEGRDQYRVTATDGQISASSPWSSTVIVDRTPPVAVVTASRAPDAATDWYKDSASLDFTSSYDPSLPDATAGSGVDAASVPSTTSRSTSGDLSGSGTVADLAGNVSTQDSKTVHVDADPPVLILSATAGGSPYTAGNWTGDSVTVSGNCTDAESGVLSGPAPLLVDVETGGTTPSPQCTDLVGHLVTVPFGPIRIDKTAPAGPAITPNRAPDAGGWYRDSVTLTFAGTTDLLGDGVTAGIGVNPATVPSPVVVSTNGTHTVTGTVKDLLGHNSTETSLQVRVDAAPPTATLNCPPGVTQGASATAQAAAGDAESGLSGPVESSLALDSATVGEHTAQFVATDLVGHEAKANCTYQVVAPPASTAGPEAESPPALDTQPPVADVTSASARVQRGALMLPLSVSEASTVTITVKTRAKIPARLLGGGRARVVKLANLRAKVDITTNKVKLKLSRAIRQLIRKLGKVAVTVTINATDAAGNSTRKTVRMTLRRQARR